MGLGERIEERLKALGISQSELARRTKLPQSTINSLIRKGRRSSPHLVKLARELRTTPAYLSEDTDDPEADFQDEALTAEERESLEQLRQLPAKDRQAVLQLLRSLSDAQEKPTLHAPGQDYGAASNG